MLRCFFVFLPLLVSCAHVDKVAAEAPKSALIFIPGYYGSALKNAITGKRFFITAGEYYFGSEAVSLHVEDLKTPPAPPLSVDGVMDRVPFFFGLFGIDVYGKFMKNLRKQADERHQEFVPLAYDWRGDLMESVRALSQTVDGLKARGVTRIEIVAHSMGSLIATYYLAYGTQDPHAAQANWSGAANIDRVVLMAGPYRGAFSLYRNMRTGAEIGSNKTYMPAETVASLPASYQLLPFPDFYLTDRGGRRSRFDLQKVEEWESRKHGLLANTKLPPEIQTRRRAFVAQQLTGAKAFSDRLQVEARPPESLKILALIGHGHPTVKTALVDPATGALQFDTELKAKDPALRLLYEDGDGSVIESSSKLPPGIGAAATIITSDRPHDKIFEEPKFQDVLKEFLN